MNRIRMLFSVCLLIALISTPATAAERVYKWTDAEGNVHFGQQPPTGTGAEALDIKQGYTAEAKPTDEERNDEIRRRRDYCKLAQQNLEALSSEGEVKRKDEYGNVTDMTEEEKATERVRAEAAVKSYCDPE